MSDSLYENLTLQISFYFMFYTREAVPLFLTFRVPQKMPWSPEYFEY